MPDDAPTFDPPEGYTPPMPRPFTLRGTRMSDADASWNETFSVMGDVPQGALADLGAAVTIKDGQIRYGTAATVRFLRAVIVPVDEARFDALIHDKDRLVVLDQLGDVMMWAAGIATDRPTSPLSSSTDGQRDAGSGSEAEPEPQAAPAAG